MEWVVPASQATASAALAVVPVAMLAWAICTLGRCRPATRHSLWLVVLLAFAMPLVPQPSDLWADAFRWVNAPAGPASPPRPALAASPAPQPARPPIQSGASEPDASERGERGRQALAKPPEQPPFPFQPNRANCTATDRLRELAPAVAVERFETTDLSSFADEEIEISRAPAVVTPFRAGVLEDPRSDVNRLQRQASGALQNDSLQAAPAQTGAAASALPSSCEVALKSKPASAEEAPQVASRDVEVEWQSFGGVGNWVAGWWELVSSLAHFGSNLPAIPWPIWVGGSAVVLLFQAGRVLRFRRKLRRAWPADREITRCVKQVQRALRLRSAPPTFVLDEPISPLIWCGRRPRLILPAQLWQQLDQRGRRAVLCHELAHLKRRDHWVCWIETALSALYWWHPVLWWARKRLHEEADLSCDAWVTWLMPRGRRTYAEALLRTRAFCSAARWSIPAGGMAATTSGPRRFARRLTMVMTSTERPRASVLGLVAVAATAAACWVTAPAWACPPKDKQAKELAKCAPAAEQGAAVRATRAEAPCAAAPPGVAVVEVRSGKPTVTIAGATSCGGGAAPVVALSPKAEVRASGGTAGCCTQRPVYLPATSSLLSTHAALAAGQAVLTLVNSAGDEGGQIEEHSSDERLDRLERQLAEISRQLAEMRAGRGGGPPAPRAREREGRIRARLRSPDAPGAPAPPAPPAPPTPHAGPVPSVPPMPPVPPQPSMPGRPGPDTFDMDTDERGPAMAREYKLPAKKMDAFYALMARDDVPIRVSRSGEDSITIHATPRQHRIVSAFLRIITQGGQERRGPRGPGAGSGEAMRRIDDRVRAALERAMHARDMGVDQADHALKAAQQELERMLSEGGGRLENVHGAMRRLREREHSLRMTATQRMQQCEAFRSSWEQKMEQARQLAEEADEVAQRANDKDGDFRRELEQSVRELERQVRELERQAREMEKRAEQAERESNNAEMLAARYESQADELDQLIDSIMSEESDVAEPAEPAEAPEAEDSDEAEGVERKVVDVRIAPAPQPVIDLSRIVPPTPVQAPVVR